MPRKLFWIVIFYLLTAHAFAQTEPEIRFEVTGVKGVILKNVQSRLFILQKSYGKKLSINDVQSIYQHAPQEIRQALEPYGYFNPIISSAGLKQDKNDWVASFNIEKGRALKVSQVNIQVSGEGKNNPIINQYINHFPLKTGAILQTQIYEKGKEGLFQAATNQGFLKAHFEKSQILIDKKTNQAQVILHLQTGQRFYFGKINFNANPYRTSFLQRFVPFREDEPFSSEKLIKFQQALNNSYYFQQVGITPDFNGSENNRIPIHISPSLPKSQRYNIGIGYGTLSGARLTAGATLRRVTDTGQHFDAQLRLSSVLSGLGAKYYIPGQNPLTDQWILGANYQKFLPKNGGSTSESISAAYTRKEDKLQKTLSVNYLFERYKVETEPNRTSKLLYPSLNIYYVDADDLLNPRFGKSLNFILQGGWEKLFSSTSFLQSEIKGKYIFSPTDFSRIILRGDLGYTAVSDLTDLPLSMRFFAGGFNSIRGYRDSSIGPGKYLQIGSFEYQNKIVENWAGAFFYDAGTASNDFRSKYKQGVGLGVIYQSMLGPVKVYVAKALNRPGKPYSIEFSIGPEF